MSTTQKKAVHGQSETAQKSTDTITQRYITLYLFGATAKLDKTKVDLVYQVSIPKELWDANFNDAETSVYLSTQRILTIEESNKLTSFVNSQYYNPCVITEWWGDVSKIKGVR